MSVQFEMPCWEINKCNKRDICLSAENYKKACWEMVQAEDAGSFHNCVDCLVYLVKHEDSIISEELFAAILKQREKIFFQSEIRRHPARIGIGSPVQARDPLGKTLSTPAPPA